MYFEVYISRQKYYSEIVIVYDAKQHLQFIISHIIENICIIYMHKPVLNFSRIVMVFKLLYSIQLNYLK